MADYDAMGETKAIAVTRRARPNEVYHNPNCSIDAEAKMATDDTRA